VADPGIPGGNESQVAWETEVPQRGPGQNPGGIWGRTPRNQKKIEIRPSVSTLFSIHFSKFSRSYVDITPDKIFNLQMQASSICILQSVKMYSNNSVEIVSASNYWWDYADLLRGVLAVAVHDQEGWQAIPNWYYSWTVKCGKQWRSDGLRWAWTVFSGI
jgi:hypothetical protein